MTNTRFTQPDGFSWGHFTNAGGIRVRHGYVDALGTARGAAVVLPGAREPAEKYFEVIRALQERSLDVHIMDWPGQGGSGRFLSDPMKAHHRGYDEQIDTLHRFMQDIVKPKRPPVMAAHSMGGQTGLRYMARYPGVFDSAMMTAPMAGIVTAPYPRRVARALVDFMRAAGSGGKYILGGGPWRAEKDVFENNSKTSDPERFRMQTEIFLANPAVQIGDQTFDWLWHAYRSMDALRPEVLKSIKTPILMGIAGADTIVDPEAVRRVAELLPDCRRVDIPAAKHEIWMERDELRDVWLMEITGFLDRRFRHNPEPAAAPAMGQERTKGP